MSAVHLVSDIKVWEEILAAKKAEERRQHAIAELHLHHAARIIQVRGGGRGKAGAGGGWGVC